MGESERHWGCLSSHEARKEATHFSFTAELPFVGEKGSGGGGCGADPKEILDVRLCGWEQSELGFLRKHGVAVVAGKD